MISSAVAAAGFLLLLLPLEAVLAQSGWKVTYHQPEKICAVTGSTVSISCTYLHPAYRTFQRSFWFIATADDPMGTIKDHDSELSNYTKPCNKKNTCTLTFSNVTESNTAEYRFRFFTDTLTGNFTGYPGVRLNVSGETLITTSPARLHLLSAAAEVTQLFTFPDLQVNVRRSYRDQGPYRLSCDTQCDLTGQQNFTWYMNDQPVGYEQTIDLQTINPGGQYTCRVSGSPVPSPAVYAPRTPTVSINSSHNIVEGDQVNLTCHSDANPPATYSWFKGNQDLQHYQPELIIQSIQSDDFGEYSCRAENLLGWSTRTFKCSSSYQDPGWKWPLVGTALAVLLLVFSLVVFFIYKKMSTSRQAREAKSEMGNEEAVAADAPVADTPGENLNYASVHFTKKSSEPLYSTVRTPKRSAADESEDRAEYALIMCRTAGTAS